MGVHTWDVERTFGDWLGILDEYEEVRREGDSTKWLSENSEEWAKLTLSLLTRIVGRTPSKVNDTRHKLERIWIVLEEQG